MALLKNLSVQMGAGYAGLRKVFHALPDRIERASKWFAILGIGAGVFMMFSVVAHVTGRYVFNQPIKGIEEANELALVIMVFLGLAFTQSRKRHVEIELVTSRLRPRAREILGILSALIVLGVMILFTVETAKAAIHSIEVGEYRFGATRFPIWPSRIALPVGGFLFCLYVIGDLARRLHLARRTQEQESL